MAVDIESLLVVPTEDEIKESIYSTLTSIGIVTTSWQPGAVTRTIIAVLAKLLVGWFTLVSTIAKSGFLDTAVGGWLTLLADLVYGVDRVEATFATGEVTFDNNSGSLYGPFDPDEFIVKSSALDKTYVNTATFTLNPGQQNVMVAIRAQEQGAASTAAPGQIDTLVTSLAGVTVTNELSVVGVDAETDATLRERCRDALGALSPNGPKSAYEYVATTPSLNGGITITRVKVLPPPGDGTVTVVIAGPDGAVSGGSVTAVQAGIDANVVPEIGTAIVVSATNVALTYSVTLYVKSGSGKSVSDWQTLAKNSLVDWVKTLPIGGIDLGSGGKVLYRAAIGVLEGMDPYVIQAVLASEVDQALTSTQVATLQASDVTVSVTVITL